MENLLTIWNYTEMYFPRNAVSKAFCFSVYTIAIGMRWANPEPAVISFVNVFPEIQ